MGSRPNSNTPPAEATAHGSAETAPPAGFPDLADVTAADTRLVPLRDVRIALTMVGGVSLAIYENGVAQELFRMIHGVGLYGVLKRLTSSHATVDIMSGTSAGGINAILLATALANGTDYAPVRDTWVEIADIDALAQDPGRPDPPSLLKGETYFLPAIERLVRGLLDPSQNPPPDGLTSIRSAGNRPPGDVDRYAGDIDLFVTGTYFEGQPRTFFDAVGQPLFTFEYAGIFHLKHRQKRGQSHLNPAMTEPESSPGDPVEDLGARARRLTRRIARVARTTSSLPAVFEPSEVEPGEMGHIIPLPGDGASYMFDGGFLNNRPLNLVLEEIYRRPAERDVLRKVMFVEPSPEVAADARRRATAPNALEALWFYKDVPGRQNLVGSFQTLASHNHDVDRLTEALKAARRMVAHPGCRPNVAQHNLWIAIRLRQQRGQLMDLWKAQLGLSGFGGILQDWDGAQAVNRERAMEETSATLSRIRTHVFDLMQDACRDFKREDNPCDSVESAAWCRDAGPAVEPPRLLYSLDDVDAGLLSRSTMRAIDEIYRALAMIGPLPATTEEPAAGHGDTHPLASNEARERRADATDNLKEVGRIVGDLFQLRDLIEIVYENLALVIRTVAASDEYRNAARLVDALPAPPVPAPGAAARETPQAVTDLWIMLMAAAANLLEPLIHGSEASHTTGDETPLHAAVRARDAAVFETVFTDRSRRICENLSNGEKGRAERQRWLQALESNAVNHPDLVFAQLEEILLEKVHAAAEEIRTAEETLGNTRTLHGKPSSLRKLLYAAATENAREGGATQPPCYEEACPFAWVWSDGKTKSTEQIREALRDLDVYMYPMEQAAELVSRDPVELIHVSPRVRLGLSDRDQPEKLSGDVLMNLGAFLKKSWRVNDLMWGRLDGSGALITTLLEPKRLADIVTSDPHAVTRMLSIIEGYVLRGEVTQPADAPADAPAAAPDAIGASLAARCQMAIQHISAWLTDPNRDMGSGALDELREILLLRHQLGIIQAEVPDALAAQIADHSRWVARGDVAAPREPDQRQGATMTRLSIAARRAPATFRDLFRPPITQEVVDSAQWAVRSWLAGEAARHVTLPELERYFKREYRIGAENIGTGIPAMVNLRRLDHMLLLAFKMASGIAERGSSSPNRFMGGMARTINSFLLRPIVRVLGVAHEFVWALGEGPRVAAAVHAVAWTLIVGSLLGLMLLGNANKFLLAGVFAVALGLELVVLFLRGRAKGWSAAALVAGLVLAVVCWHGLPPLFSPIVIYAPTGRLVWGVAAGLLIALVACLVLVFAPTRPLRE